MKIHIQKAVLTATRGEREGTMEMTLILMELEKIRVLLTTLLLLHGLSLVGALIAAVVYFARQFDRLMDEADSLTV